jgi:hypothetical protein
LNTIAISDVIRLRLLELIQHLEREIRFVTVPLELADDLALLDDQDLAPSDVVLRLKEVID